MANDTSTEDNNELVTSYLRVRTAIGALAIVLPIMLVASTAFEAVDFVPSISEFFYTPMREALVGTIGAIAVFLISYKGYPRDETRAAENWAEQWLTDRRVSYAAAIGALFVAIFPTRTNIDMVLEPVPLAHAIMEKSTAGILHVAGAALFFLALAAFCLSNFRRGGAKGRSLFFGLNEDSFYKLCGYILIACIIVLGIVAVINHKGPADLAATLESIEIIFWAETVGLVTFAFAWLTKGKARQTVPDIMREMILTKRN